MRRALATALVVIVIVIAVVAAAGCTPRPPAHCWAVHSGAEGGLAPLVDGEALPVVKGPQGLYMVTIGLQADGIDPGNAEDVAAPENPLYDVQLAGPSGELVSYRRGKLGFQPLGDGTCELPEVRLIFGPDVPEIAGTACALSLAISDRHGQRCESDVTVVPARP